MSERIDDARILREFETVVRGPNGANRFITVIAQIDIPLPGRGADRHSYTSLIGPVLKEHDVLGTSCLSSIAGVDAAVGELTECSITAETARWDESSERVELALELSASEGVVAVKVVSSVTILAA